MNYEMIWCGPGSVSDDDDDDSALYVFDEDEEDYCADALVSINLDEHEAKKIDNLICHNLEDSNKVHFLNSVAIRSDNLISRVDSYSKKPYFGY